MAEYSLRLKVMARLALTEEINISEIRLALADEMEANEIGRHEESGVTVKLQEYQQGYQQQRNQQVSR